MRAALAAAFRRGNLQVSLSISGQVARETVRLNPDILDRLVEAGEALRDRIGGEPLRADVLLSIKGVVEVASQPEAEGEAEARNAAMLESFGEALRSLASARREEGERLNAVVSAQVQRIAELAEAARHNPSRSPEAVRAQVAEQVSRLMETGAALDPDRLHQEAVIVATRADIQEELDRLYVACRGRAGAAGLERRHRPQVRLPRAGVQPRGQHAVLKGLRPVADRDRPRPQDRHRPAARAGPEHRVKNNP